MKAVFLAHVEKDQSLAIELASELEILGYSIWYYERDSLPGQSYLLNTHSAIEQCKVFLVLISPNSLASRQVEVELERAHEKSRIIIPVLLNVTDAEFKRKKPLWEQIVGTSVSCMITPSIVRDVGQRIAAGLAYAGIQPFNNTADTVKEDRPRMSVPISSGLVKCPDCGVENTGDNRFCSECGASLYDTCPGCGIEIRADLRFCVKCGSDIPKLKKINELKEAVAKALETVADRQDDIVSATEILLEAEKAEDAIATLSGTGSVNSQPLSTHVVLCNLWNEEALASEIFPSSGIKHIELLSRVFSELPDRKDIQNRIEELSSERDKFLKELKELFNNGHFLNLLQIASKSRWADAEITSIVAQAQKKIDKTNKLIQSRIPELIEGRRNCELNKVLVELESLAVPIDWLSELRQETGSIIEQAQQLYEQAAELAIRNPKEAAQTLDNLSNLCADYPDSLNLRKKINLQISLCLSAIDDAKRHIADKEYKKVLNLLDPIVSTYNSEEAKSLHAVATNGAKSVFRKRLCIAIAIVLLAIVSIIIHTVVAINRNSNYKTYSSYCKKANSEFSSMEYGKAVELYKEALKVPGYNNDASTKKSLMEALLALEQKPRFDKLMTEGNQCLVKKDWASAEKAFQAALKVKGYESNSNAIKSLKECDNYFTEFRNMNKVVFSNMVSKGSKELAENNYKMAFESFNEAIKIPGYENNETAIKQKEQAKLSLDCKNQFDKWMIEGAKELAAENYKKALEFFDEAMRIPGYNNNEVAVMQIKQTKLKEQVKLNLDQKKQFDRLIIEGREFLIKEDWANADKAFNAALNIPGYKNSTALLLDDQKTLISSDWNAIRVKVKYFLYKARDTSRNIDQRIKSANSAITILEKLDKISSLPESSKIEIANLELEADTLRNKINEDMMPPTEAAKLKEMRRLHIEQSNADERSRQRDLTTQRSGPGTGQNYSNSARSNTYYNTKRTYYNTKRTNNGDTLEDIEKKSKERL